MRTLILALLLALPLAGQTFVVSNLSDRNIEELELWEQQNTVIKQIRDLVIAGDTGSYVFDVAAEVCLNLREQMKSDTPHRATVIRANDHTRPCRVEIPGWKARIMWDGWDWNEPDSNPSGTTRTVCASGCDHTTLQAALDARTFGDVIQLTAGQTFGDGNTREVFIRDDHDFTGNCPYYTVIEPSGYSSNFTRGVRVTGNTNMATVVGGDNDSGGSPDFNPVLEFLPTTAEVTAINTATDVLTTGTTPHGFIAGDKLVWIRLPKAPNNWINQTNETGLYRTRYYYVESAPTTTTLKLSETPGGAAVDITAEPSGGYGSLGLRKWNRPVSCVKVRGLEITHAAGDGATQTLVRQTENVARHEAAASHIIFDHLYVHGIDDEVGPLVGIATAARYLAVRDSLVTEVKSSGANDSTALGLRMHNGPAIIENNGLSASAINFYIGGVQPMLEYVDNGTFGGIVVRNNYHWKKNDWYVFHIATVPSGTCHVGSIWKETTSEPDVCYTCTTGTWGSPDADCNGWFDWNIKNLWETKHSTNVLTENLWADLSPQGDVSQDHWYVSKAESTINRQGWINAGTMLYNFRSRYTASGPLLRGQVGDNSLGSKLLGPLAYWNGLSTHVDPDLYHYEASISNSPSAIMATGSNDLGISVQHITHVGFTTTDNEAIQLISPENSSPIRRNAWWSIKDSILAMQHIRVEGAPANGSVNCAAVPYGIVVGGGGTSEFEANVTVNAGGLDFSTCATKATNETSIANVGFTDHTSNWKLASAGTTGDYRAGQAQDATDGKDVGVDTELLFDGLGGSDPTAGLMGWSYQFDVAITAIGPTTATVEWDRPNAANSCSLYLYTDYARTVEHADTDTAGERLDTRAGNDVTAGHVTFNLGVAALTTKTQYWFEIDCATDAVKMVGSLMTN